MECKITKKKWSKHQTREFFSKKQSLFEKRQSFFRKKQSLFGRGQPFYDATPSDITSPGVEMLKIVLKANNNLKNKYYTN